MTYAPGAYVMLSHNVIHLDLNLKKTSNSFAYKGQGAETTKNYFTSVIVVPFIVLLIVIGLLIAYDVYLCYQSNQCICCQKCCKACCSKENPDNDDDDYENDASQVIANRHIRGTADDDNVTRKRPKRIKSKWIFISLYIAAFCLLIANLANYFDSPLLTATINDLGNSLKSLSAILSLIEYSSQDMSLLSNNINTTVLNHGCTAHISSTNIRKIINFNNIIATASNHMTDTVGISTVDDIQASSYELLNPKYISDKNYYFYAYTVLAILLVYLVIHSAASKVVAFITVTVVILEIFLLVMATVATAGFIFSVSASFRSLTYHLPIDILMS